MVNRMVAGWQKMKKKTRDHYHKDDFVFYFNDLTDQSIALEKNLMRS